MRAAALCAWAQPMPCCALGSPRVREGTGTALGSASAAPGTSGPWLCSEFPAPRGSFYSLVLLTNICKNLSLLLRGRKSVPASPSLSGWTESLGPHSCALCSYIRARCKGTPSPACVALPGWHCPFCAPQKEHIKLSLAVSFLV